MKSNVLSLIGGAAAFSALLLILGCNSGDLPVNPDMPDAIPVERQAMFFYHGTQTIFGSEEVPATEVDMATIQWDFYPVDGFKWVVAVGTEDPPGGAETDPSYPVVRFLGRQTDGSPALGATFVVEVGP